MPDNSNIPAVPSGENEGYRKRVVEHALGLMRVGKKQILTPDQALVETAKDITSRIREHIKPILAAGGWKDIGSLRVTIATLYLQEFNKLSKEEVVNLLTILHLEIMMEVVDSSPSGGDTPDLMGGH